MAKVQLQNGKSVPMAELQIGESVQTGLDFKSINLLNLCIVSNVLSVQMITLYMILSHIQCHQEESCSIAK